MFAKYLMWNQTQPSVTRNIEAPMQFGTHTPDQIGQNPKI